MSNVLSGSHYCEKHQGNHSHYDEHNCELCSALAEAKRLRAEVADTFAESERRQNAIDHLRAEVAELKNAFDTDQRAIEDNKRLRAENSHLHHQTNKLGGDVLRLRTLLREAREFLGDNDREDTLIRAIDAALGGEKGNG